MAMNPEHLLKDGVLLAALWQVDQLRAHTHALADRTSRMQAHYSLLDLPNQTTKIMQMGQRAIEDLVELRRALTKLEGLFSGKEPYKNKRPARDTRNTSPHFSKGSED